MFNITNIETLGNDYTITDQNGKLLKTIQVVTHTDILDAALGKFSDNFDSISSYLEESISMLSGNEELDPTKVLWYSTPDEEIVISEVLKFAMENGYDKIILEYLDDLE